MNIIHLMAMNTCCCNAGVMNSIGCSECTLHACSRFTATSKLEIMQLPTLGAPEHSVHQGTSHHGLPLTLAPAVYHL